MNNSISLQGAYYIICTNETIDWWQLRKTSDHQVVTSGVSREYVLLALEKQVKRYKNRTNLEKHWGKLQYTLPLPDLEFKKRQKEYELVGTIYQEEVDAIVRHIEDNLMPVKTITRRRTNFSPKPSRVETPIQPQVEEPQEEETIEVDMLPIIRKTIRRKIIKRK